MIRTANSLSRSFTATPAGDDDIDPAETRDWLQALQDVLELDGPERALYLLNRLEERARDLGIGPHTPISPYRNTIPLEKQGPYPGDIRVEEYITAINRWNAFAMVARANAEEGTLGGHVASYASAAELFEVGFNHFFEAGDDGKCGDLVFFQPHSAPGVYARAFLEGRLDEDRLRRFRREVDGPGLSSYPHPWLMPDFWQFTTGSMGIGPINAIYQARFIRYLEHRGLARTGHRHVWGVFGDGEMDEPESVGALSLAARENLDNLTFIINCNLQRLDGPVRGNGQIIQELESLFSGAGWNVIKVLWGSDWDPLFARDKENVLLKRFADTLDGEFQTLGANDGRYNREHFFELDPKIRALVEHMSAEEIDGLRRGGHDMRKLYAAYDAARRHSGQPTVILAKTKKGYGMGKAGESRMTAHQKKKFDVEAIRAFRDRLGLPMSDQDAADLRLFRPDEKSDAIRYLHDRRRALNGYLPKRAQRAVPPPLPDQEMFRGLAGTGEGRSISTTMAFVRMLASLLKHTGIGPRIVPIVADEARTFGMDSLFRQIGIYSPVGQLYEPEDADSLLYYRESKDGQLLEEGITEAGALSSWCAAATSYSNHGLAMLPFYIFYSMFGFQRVGDLIWAAADQRARGFLVGATAGRTTLNGEGLQHQDGSSLLAAATVPNCRAYDPAFACELAVILEHGTCEMMERQRDVFYYVTVTNENYVQAPLVPGSEDEILRGMYLFRPCADSGRKTRVRLLGSGAIFQQVLAAGELLENDWGIAAECWSVTSFTELARDARATDRLARLQPERQQERSHVQRSLAGPDPVIAATDYVCAYPQLIAAYLECPFVALGTDGFGRSDTRGKLRQFFEVDPPNIVIAALETLVRQGRIPRTTLAAALERYAIAGDEVPPWQK